MRFVPLPLNGVLRRASRAAVILVALAPAAAVGQTVTFKSDWETGLVGDGLFEQLQVTEANRFARSKTKPRTGKYSAQVTVRPGDVLFGGERAEALFMTNSKRRSPERDYRERHSVLCHQRAARPEVAEPDWP